MVKERMDLLELLHKGGMDGDVDFLREALRVLVEGIMDAEVSSRIGAEYGERSPERVTQRNGYRSRAWDTRVGTMELHIPKLREGSYFPSLLEPRRRSERALLAVIQQAYVEGVSTRRVDDLVKALGCEGISKSQVSRICQELDVVVDGFLGRPLDGGPYPYLWLGSLPVKWCKSASSCCCCLGGCRLREIGLRKSFVEGQNGGCEVSTSDDPFVVLLSQDGANEAAHGRPVREDAHHIGASPDLLVETLLWVVGPELLPVGEWEAGEGQDVGSRFVQ